MSLPLCAGEQLEGGRRVDSLYIYRLSLGGCVIFFDEGHNLPDQCCDHFTSSLSMPELETVCGTIAALNTPYLLDLVRNDVNVDVDGLSDLGPRLVEFIRRVRSVKVESNYVELSVGFIYNLFEVCRIDPGTMRRAVKSLNENHAALAVGGGVVGAMESTEQLIRTLYPNDGKIEGHYGICLINDRTLHLLCFSPAIGLEHLMMWEP
jgi:hypothetical protein